MTGSSAFRMFSALLIAIILSSALAQRPVGISCYDPRTGRPQRCMPPFINAAFNVPVEATNTCGLRGPQEYCLQTGVTGATKSCDICDARDPRKQHPPEYLTDFHDRAKMTWWQSETMLQGVQHPATVNLTLHLGKSFDITYVRLKFYSSRPESFAIYKKTSDDQDWVPYQFYSGSCESTYKLKTRDIIVKGDETKAICTNEYSDVSPLTGGSVAFSTLEGRPSAYDFENSSVLQEFVTATQIMITLTRMNTFGDEVFQDPKVLRSYFYAISDFAVGGRCRCNGHASACVASTGQGLQDMLVCQCEHHTKGINCDECDDFYNDQPWGMALKESVNECQPCDCNGLSRRCYFDEKMWNETGHGGHCMDCQDNTAGPHCERCKDFYYRRDPRERCMACNCDPVGSEDLQCDSNGQCQCKPGVGGEKCDRCLPNFYDFGPGGCRECGCFEDGSRENHPECSADTGMCICKEYVEGQNCTQCKLGHFNLDPDNKYGCVACFCYGHSSVCSSADGFSMKLIESTFDEDDGEWIGVDREGINQTVSYNGRVGNIGLSADGYSTVYFSAPDAYLGDQRFSYNQNLKFTLRIGEDNAQASVMDVSVEGDGLTISAPIYGQNNPMPRTVDEEYSFRLHEHYDYMWTPQLSTFEFQRMLANITAIKIRATYGPDGTGFLDDFVLESAIEEAGDETVSYVEQCDCLEGYIGQFCEQCAPGYHREPKNGGPLARCVPCNCNGHSDSCDVDTGDCACEDNTAGENCERCESGYYGYALAGTPDDCQKCPCPDDGECVEMLDGEVLCINCKEGHTGPRCGMCLDGYFGDPTGKYGEATPCSKCACNDNIDPNAVLNCNTTTGECLKCVYNTGGFNCDECLPGFYGDPFATPKGDCKACDCYDPGSIDTDGDIIECDQVTGQCDCQPNVDGRQCDVCKHGYWNIDSEIGCELCRCEMTGSYNDSCDITTGQCPCKPGVNGRQCAECLDLHYGYSTAGCSMCDCDMGGSTSDKCDVNTGQCPCKENIEGQYCDRCMENKYNKDAGCLDCPACYGLVQKKVNLLREKLDELRDMVENIGNNPQAINDTDFIRQIKAVNESVNQLAQDALNSVEWVIKPDGTEGPIADQIKEIEDSISAMESELGKIHNDIINAKMSSSESQMDITVAEDSIEEAEQVLQEAEDYIKTDGSEALLKAREAQEKLGEKSQRMTEIAKQAREEAERQEEEAMKIEGTATAAFNTSNEAYHMAQEALGKPSETARDILKLRDEVEDTSRLYEQTKTMSERALKQAEETYNEALQILNKAKSFILPDVQPDELNDKAKDIKTEAQTIKEQAAKLMEEHEKLMADVARLQIQTENLLEDGIRQQQIADELLADADMARGIAQDAVDQAEKTLTDAQETFETLKEFDQKVQESEAKAQEALDMIPDIEETIVEAESKTAEAEADLQGAEADAVYARDIAQEAESTAIMASEEADAIREGAASSKEQAEELKQQSDMLATDVAESENQLSTLETQAAEDAETAKKALEEADIAKTSAEESSMKVHDALQTVETILSDLDNLDTIDLERLEKLEQSLEEVELQLQEANVEEAYQSLTESSKQQKLWIEDYTSEIILLERDVANIRQINATIPRDCMKGAPLEPEIPTFL